jgi:uncharacterized protein YraI
MKNFILLLVVVPFLTASCATPQLVASPTATAVLLPTSSPTQAPTATPPPPPTLTATPQPIEGTLTIKVNVRSGPGMQYDSLGQLNSGEKIQIMVRDDTGKWYRILYPAAPDGSGWVTTQFVQVAAGTEVPLQATPTEAGPSGRVVQRLNVRSGPGMAFDTLGMLEPDTLVSLTGKNSTASWLQIIYPVGSGGSGGRGWVTAQYLQADASRLPVLDDFGTPVASAATGPTPIPEPPTPTVGPAFADHDSPANPAIRVTFSASGTRQFTYSSQVSTPDGDPEDWLTFTPYAVNGSAARLVFSLTCSGNGTLTVELWRGGSRLSGWGTLACGDLDKLITLPAGQAYAIRLAPAPGQGLRLVDYVLSVQNKS